MSDQVNEKTGEVMEAEFQVQDFSPRAIAEQTPQQVTFSAIAKVELDKQVSTAKMFSRAGEITKRRKQAESMISDNADFAKSCKYTLKYFKGENGQAATGPSIRFAEAVVSAWGNIYIKTEIVEIERDTVKAVCMCWDLENNVREECEAIRPLEYTPDVDKKKERSRRLNAIKSAGMAAQSVAKRDAVLRVIPKYFWDPLYQFAQKVALGDIATLPARREATLKAIYDKYKIKADRVCAALEVSGKDDIDLERFMDLESRINAINDGLATAEQIFPPIEFDKNEPASNQAAGNQSEKLAGELADKKRQEEAAAASAKKEESKPAAGTLSDKFNDLTKGKKKHLPGLEGEADKFDGSKQ